LGASAKTTAWRQISLVPGAIALLVLILIAALTSPLNQDGARVFFELGNLTDVLRQVALIGIISLGMTLVVLTAGIDLSVGSVLALASVLIATCLTRGFPTWSSPARIAASIGVAVAACACIGAINGLLIARLRIQPFIVTLAAMIGVRGFAKWFSGNQNIDIGFGEDVASQFAAILNQKIAVIGCYGVLAGLFWVLLTRTVFGRHVRAVGDNPTAALYTGLPIARTQICVYSLAGLLAGIAGVLYAAENHQGNPNSGVAYELDAIAAVVIGGTRLSGGQGTITGTIIGTLIMGVLTNMLRLNNVDSNIEMIIKAIIIVLAVAVQRVRKS
jgi:ribose transport system permease protein